MSKKDFNIQRGFRGFVYFQSTAIKNLRQRAAFLRKARKASTRLKHSGFNSKTAQMNSPLAKIDGQAKSSKVLLFKNIFNSVDKKQADSFCLATHYLASSLKKEGIEVVFANAKVSLEKKVFTCREELEEILDTNPEIKVIGISLCEDFFEQARSLIKFIRSKTKAFIGVGGVMPTLTPEHVFAHLPECNFLVRGSGEYLLPQLVRILANKDIDSEFSQKEVFPFSNFKGFLFSAGNIFISAQSNIINSPRNFDESFLDFSFLKKEDLKEGLKLFTSRGCYNNCFFCTSFSRGRFNAKSFNAVRKIIQNYHKRLTKLFGSKIPKSAFKLSFYDDDFLGAPQRAKDILNYLSKRPFKVDFFQTGINSFFERKNKGYSQKINKDLVNSIRPVSFVKSKTVNIYLGTENFSDIELGRLGKGYNFAKVKKVVTTLSQKRIYQTHHLILSNRLTTIDNLLENLLKIAIFQAKHKPYFKILAPPTPYLVSFYPSLSYRLITMQGESQALKVRNYLSIERYPEYDYPLVNNDIPEDAVVKRMIPIIYNLFLKHNDYLQILDEALCKLLFIREKFPVYRKKISSSFEKYKNYPEIIFRESKTNFCPDRHNLQLMITRRCQLNCDYCPIVKKNIDMDEETLIKAIDLVFTSSQDNLRIDFTGGEPLLRFDLVKKGVSYAKTLAKKRGKSVSFYMVTNLIALTDEIADFIAGENFFLELSVDGEEKFHNRHKLSRNKEINPYRYTTKKLKKIFARKINNYAVMVAEPDVVQYLYKNFCHLVQLGFQNVGINYALCSFWESGRRRDFFHQVDKIIKRFFFEIKEGRLKLSNLGSRLEPAVLNNEVMANSDGKVYFLSDWLFEKAGRTDIPALGKISDFKKISQLSLPNSLNLLRITDYYNRQQRKVIFNNIETGIITGNYFKLWKKRLNL